jgi:hypothetical protein
MKPAVYLTDPEEMRKARSNQPRVSSEQLHAQREAFQRASEKFSAAARKEKGHSPEPISSSVRSGMTLPAVLSS